MKEVRVPGAGSGVLEQEGFGFDVKLGGPAAKSGLPQGWSQFESRLESGKKTVSGGISANPTANGTKVSAWVEGPSAFGPENSRARGILKAVWDDKGATLDDVSLALHANEDDGLELLAMTARGRFDRAEGVLTLNASGEAPAPALIGLGPDGVRVTGLGGVGDLKVDAEFHGDAAGLSRWSSSLPPDLKGRWRGLVALRSGDDGLQFGSRVAVDALIWGHRDVSGGDLLKLDVRGLVAPDRGRLDLSEFSLRSRYLLLDASGRIDDPFGHRRADLAGKLVPEYEAISQWLAANIEPGAKISGRPRSFRLRGDLGAVGSESVERRPRPRDRRAPTSTA